LENRLNYYSLLGVKRKASADEIKRAYRKLVFRYHPDRNPSDQEAAVKLKQIMEAYDVLSNSEKRTSYDKASWIPFEDGSDQSDEHSSGNGFHFTHEFTAKSQPEPRCPQCSASGMTHVISRKSGSGPSRGKQFITSPFQVIFCDQCGHVYGVAGSSH
jgi:curved DNA-binding protein CbpA